MVLSSVQVRMDSSDWPQSVMHNRTLKPTMMEQGLKPPPDQALKCPRCDSSNTKFCYYNNYSLSQPRHFCKTCKRYWTKGGTLRNVPVGGGCRKNKRAKRTIDQAAAPHHGPINEASTSAAAPGNELSSCPPLGNTHGQLIPGVSSSNMYYALPSNSTNGNLSLAFAAARLGDQRALSHCNTNNSANNNSSEFLRISCGTQSASFDIPHGSLSGISSLSALSALNMARLGSLKPNFSCLSFCGSNGAEHGNHGVGSDLSTFFESYPTQIPEASAVLNAHNSEDLSAPFSLSLDNNSNSDIQWRSQQQKLPNIALKAEGQAGDHDHAAAQALLPFEDHNNININMNSTENDQKIVTSIMPSYSIKVEEENRLGSEWQVPADQTLFEAAGDSTNLYWNGGAWPDLAIYGSSVSPLI